MRNLKLHIMFDGSAYHGWQSQKNAVTICDTMIEAIKKVTGQEVKLSGCSRTDAGVHALDYCANFLTESNIPQDKMPYALNNFLPSDIRVMKCQEVPLDFHAQYCCVGKEYRYFLHNSQFDNPFYQKKVYYYRYHHVDVESLNTAAQAFVGTHDFTSFMAAGSPVKSTVRTIKYFQVAKHKDLICFQVFADGFLYNMVRIMVGTLLEVNRGRFEASDIPLIIKAKQRAQAGITAPPCGLYLSRVQYDE